MVADAPAGLATGLRNESTQEQLQASGASFHPGQLKGLGLPLRLLLFFRPGAVVVADASAGLAMGLRQESTQEQRQA